MDIVDYFLFMQTELRRRTGVEPISERYSESPGSDGSTGFLDVTVPLTEEAILRVYEWVEIVEQRYPRRTGYGYILVVAGRHLQSWEDDPWHDEMPVHEHVGPDRIRRQGTEVSLREAIYRAWTLLSPDRGDR